MLGKVILKPPIPEGNQLQLKKTYFGQECNQAGPQADEIKDRFLQNQPDTSAGDPNREWMPIIPLCGAAKDEVPQPPRKQIKEENVREITGLLMKRMDAIRPYIAGGKLGEVLSAALHFLLHTFIVKDRVGDAITEALVEGLAPNVET